MSQLPSPPIEETKSPRGKKRRMGYRSALIGCASVFGLFFLLSLATCVAGGIWLTRSGEVPKEGAALVGGEDVYVSLYLDPKDKAVSNLIAELVQRLREAEQGLVDLPPLMSSLREMQMRQVFRMFLPLRVQASFDLTEDGEPDDFLFRVSLSRNYRQYRLMYSLMTRPLETDPSVSRREIAGQQVLIMDRAEKPLSIAFVENEFFWGTPDMLAHALEQEAPGAGGSPHLPEPAAELLRMAGDPPMTLWAVYMGESPWPLALESAQRVEISGAAMGAALTSQGRLQWKIVLEPAEPGADLERLAGLLQERREILLSHVAPRLATEVTGAEVDGNRIILRGRTDPIARFVDELFTEAMVSWREPAAPVWEGD